MTDWARAAQGRAAPAPRGRRAARVHPPARRREGRRPARRLRRATAATPGPTSPQFLRTYEAACAVLHDARRLPPADRGGARASRPPTASSTPRSSSRPTSAAAAIPAPGPTTSPRSSRAPRPAARRSRRASSRSRSATSARSAPRPPPARRRRARGRFVTGFGMAGEERFGHPADFARAFAIAARGRARPDRARRRGRGRRERRAPRSTRCRSRASATACAPIEDPALVRRLAAEGHRRSRSAPARTSRSALYPDWRGAPGRARCARPACRSRSRPTIRPTSTPTSTASTPRSPPPSAGRAADFRAINRDRRRAPPSATTPPAPRSSRA